MPQVCSVAVCRNVSNKTAKDISYFSFPKDPQVRKLWIQACRRQGSINADNARVCGVHFEEDDYVRDLKAELLGYTPTRRLLKKTAVPSLLLRKDLAQKTSVSPEASTAEPESTPNVNGTSENELDHPSLPSSSFTSLSLPSSRESRLRSPRLLRLQSRNIRKRALETLRNLSPIQRTADVGTNTEPIVTKVPRCKCSRIVARLRTHCNNLQLRIKPLKMKIDQLEKELQRKEVMQPKLIQAEVERICGRVFTKAQIRCLMKNKKRGNWQDEDFEKAIIFSSISRQAYVYKRKQGEPLPSFSTLTNWINKDKDKEKDKETV